jgi:DNA-binding NarL/FixJ family response regulator
MQALIPSPLLDPNWRASLARRFRTMGVATHAALQRAPICQAPLEASVTPTTTRILLADDHAVVRRGLAMVLDAQPDLVVVAEAATGAEAVAAAAREAVDLAVLDVSMPGMTGLEAAAELTRQLPALKVLMLSMYDNERYVYEALRAGACGYMLKSAADRDLVDGCRAAMRGEPFLYPAAIAVLIADYLERIRTSVEAPPDPLTPRELEVVKLIAEAYTSDGIALELGITRRTVDRHRENILAKLGMRDRVELARYAIRRGLIEP